MSLNFNPPSGARVNWGHPLSRGLVGYYLFNEKGGQKVNSSTALGVGSLINNPVWSGSQYGTSITFDGGTQYAQLPVSINVAGDFTLSLLVKFNSVASNGQLYSEWVNPVGKNIFIFLNGSDQRVYFYRGDVSGNQDGTPAISNALTTGVWYNLIFTQAGTLKTIYVNAVSSFTATATYTGYVGSNGGQIGAWNNNGTFFNYTSAAFNNIRMYNRALSAQEVLQLYLQPFAGVNVPPRGTYNFTSSGAVTKSYGFVFG